MNQKLVEYLESMYGDISGIPEWDLHVKNRLFNYEMVLKNAKMVGNNECFNADEFYQYVLCEDRLYKAYFEMEDEDGNPLDFQDIDYDNAYRIEDITNLV